jgi:4-hydroxy-3-methylbut-2-enyl diphosphate reductase
MNGIGEFAKSHELIFFVCGSKSSNGKILFNECKRKNQQSYQIEGPEDIDFTLTEGVNSIGICGATSTPKWLMENCKKAIINYHNNK